MPLHCDPVTGQFVTALAVNVVSRRTGNSELVSLHSEEMPEQVLAHDNRSQRRTQGSLLSSSVHSTALARIPSFEGIKGMGNSITSIEFCRAVDVALIISGASLNKAPFCYVWKNDWGSKDVV
ncbi:hypothetical protein HMI56_005077 [Coelomomyces lativittatus]|nr:hypothetical protein HMI56_005077 [Coelomomyces lativittatus]